MVRNIEDSLGGEVKSNDITNSESNCHTNEAFAHDEGEPTKDKSELTENHLTEVPIKVTTEDLQDNSTVKTNKLYGVYNTFSKYFKNRNQNSAGIKEGEYNYKSNASNRVESRREQPSNTLPDQVDTKNTEIIPDLVYQNKGFEPASPDETVGDQDSNYYKQIVPLDDDPKAKDWKSPPEKDGRCLLWPQIFGAVTSATVHLAVGCIIGFTGVTLPSLMDHESGDIVLNKLQASIFSSIVNIGAIVGSVLSSLMMTWLGQRMTLLVYLPVGMVFWISMSFAQSFWLLVLSRVVQGVVIGVCAGCANNYVVETVHSSVRGRLCGLIDLSRQVGFLFMYVVGSSHLSWRYVGLICGLVSMSLPFLGMIFLPHSPRWLALQGRMDEAKKALIFFRGENYNVDPEFNEISDQVGGSEKGTKVWDQLKRLTERSIAIRFVVLAVLLFASHFTGNFAFIAYSVSIFESAEVHISPYVSTIIVACARIIGVVVYITIADKFGRRPLFMIPLFLSGVSMISLGSFFCVKSLTDDTSLISWLPLTSVIFYVVLTMMSHPVLMLLRSELLPTSVRSVGVGLLYLSFFLGSFGVSISYPYMVDSVGSHWTFWLYGGTSFAMVLITAVAIPETQGKSLEEIGELFEKKKVKNNA